MEASEAAKNALECVLGAKKDESIAIFCDYEKIRIGEAFSEGALKLGLQTTFVPLRTQPSVFRTEIPDELTDIITKRPPSIYINLLRGNRQETIFRIQLTKMETKDHKARLGHCPGVTLDMLTEGALALTAQDHGQMQTFANRLITKLKGATELTITTPAGSELQLSVVNRPFFTDTIINWQTLKWMNLPTGETLAAPVEDSLNGTLVCDMAIGGIGKIDSLLTLTVEKGKVVKALTQNPDVLKQVQDSLDTDEYSDTVGEFAFGINPKARFIQEFLEAEKLWGTAHIAFGNNADYPGGQNKSKNHMDLLMSRPTVKAMNKIGQTFTVLSDGYFQPL